MKKKEPAPLGSLAAIEASLQAIIHLLADMATRVLTASPAAAEPDYSELNYQTLDEAAEALGLSMSVMRRVVHREDFPGYKVGPRWVVPKKSLAEWNAKMAKEKAEL